MTEFDIATVEIPRELDPTGKDEFCQAIALSNLSDELAFGTTDTAFDVAEELALWQPSEFERYRMLVATVDGRVVGRGTYETTVGEDADTAWVIVHVHPDFRRNGIGSALLAELETIARRDNKRQVVMYAPSSLNEGPVLAAPTEFGSVSKNNPETQFLLAHGFSFEQVERVSRLALAVPGLLSLVDDAIDRSNRDYALHEWVDLCPERWREDLAVLYTRMSTDEPSAGLEPPEDVWSVDRLLEYQERLTESTLSMVYAAVEHVDTGTVVAYTALAVPREPSRAVNQAGTLVLQEHRGSRIPAYWLPRSVEAGSALACSNGCDTRSGPTTRPREPQLAHAGKTHRNASRGS
ncbi:GNAT family N-acetyltransferase [Rhodoglobus aureus]|uniref:N-acetyltransferase domain-containing protein n=1 Tax=Rhodoglobus aureus TaxID=191497 RepID=A0ABP4G8C3_9MICO